MLKRYPIKTVRLAACIAAMALVSAQAATYYWDENGLTAGFGTAGTGSPSTWAAPTAGGAYGWNTSGAGTLAIGPVTTTTSDPLYFGTDTDGLGAGTITILGTVSANHLFFGKASGALTLNGGTISLSSGDSEIRAMTGTGSTTTMTINSDISKAGGTLWIGRQTTTDENYIFNGVLSGMGWIDLRPVNYGAFVAFNGINTFSCDIGLVTGQLNVNSVADSGVACSLGTGSILGMGGGGGQAPLLWYTGSSTGSTDRTIRSVASGDCRIVAQDGALDLSGSLTTSGTGSYNFNFSGTADTGTNRVSGAISDGAGTITVRVKNAAPQDGPAEDGFWIFGGNNTYSGGTIINGGALFVNGSHSGGAAYTAQSGGTLGGNGAITNTLITVDSGGTLSPGSDIGTLTLDSPVTMNGDLKIELNDKYADKLVIIDNTLTLSASSSLTVTHVDGEIAGRSWDIVSCEGSAPGTISQLFESGNVTLPEKCWIEYRPDEINPTIVHLHGPPPLATVIILK